MMAPYDEGAVPGAADGRAAAGAEEGGTGWEVERGSSVYYD